VKREGNLSLNLYMLFNIENNRKFWVTGLMVLMLPLLFGFVHKFYVSKTMIEYNARTAQFEVTAKVFTDDLELAIGGAQSGEMRLGTDRETTDADTRIERYLREHFRITADGKPIEWRWVGKEVDGDMTFCYLEFYRTPDFSTLQVFNDVLVSQYAEQQNIVDLIMHSSTQTLIFNKDLVKQEFRR
jgi:hypothetical protein